MAVPVFPVQKKNIPESLTMGRKIIFNGTIITPCQLIRDGIVLINGTEIEEAGQRGSVAEPGDAYFFCNSGIFERNNHLDGGNISLISLTVSSTSIWPPSGPIRLLCATAL